MSSAVQSCACPSCNHVSHRIHSQYARTPLDLSWCGQAIQLAMRVFRFFCDHQQCPQRIFCQRHPNFLAPHAQATQRFHQNLQEVAQEAGGEGGARLGSTLGLRRSADTSLRHLKQTSLPISKAPRVVGIDDWAWRKGHHYGTILCDLEQSEVIDILPDREVETVVAWLKRHPSIEIITRDRAKCYREAASVGAPQAVQIADRWHLLKNLLDAVKRVLEGYQPLLKKISIQISSSMAEDKKPTTPHVETQTYHPFEIPDDTGTLEKRVREEGLAPAIRRRFTHILMHRLRDEGVSIKEMMQRTQVSRATVYRYLNLEFGSQTVIKSPEIHDPPLTARQLRHACIGQLRDAGVTIAEIMHQTGVSRATVYRVLMAMGQSHRGQRTYFPGVEQRHWSTRFDELWQAGYRDHDELWQMLRQAGYTMSFDKVRRAIYRQRTPLANIPKGLTRNQVYRPRKAAWCFVLDPFELDEVDYQFLLTCLQVAPDLLQLYVLAQGFQRLIVHSRRLALFEHWMTQATISPFTEIQQFARGLLQDEAAVRAALTHAWSNGPVEGQVLRLKLNRRKMYGRGSLELLKRRVMGTAT